MPPVPVPVVASAELSTSTTVHSAELHRNSAGHFNIIFCHESLTGAVLVKEVEDSDVEDDRYLIRPGDHVVRINGVSVIGSGDKLLPSMTLPEVQRMGTMPLHASNPRAAARALPSALPLHPLVSKRRLLILIFANVSPSRMQWRNLARHLACSSSVMKS